VLVAFFTGLIAGGWVIWEADIVDPPGASLVDKDQENLTRIEYPSQKGMR